MTSYRRRDVITGALTAVTAAGLAPILSFEARSAAKSVLNMQLGWLLSGNQLGEVCAKALGYYDAEGIELNLIQRFTFMPDPFDGLGFEGNLTLVDSSGQIRPGEKHTLPQTSDFNYNVAVFYDRGPLTLRLAGSYVSRNIFAVGSDATSDVYSQPRFRLDFGGSYKVTDELLWYVDVKNITNTLLQFTLTPSRNFPIQREFYGPTFLTGVRVALNGPEAAP